MKKIFLLISLFFIYFNLNADFNTNFISLSSGEQGTFRNNSQNSITLKIEHVNYRSFSLPVVESKFIELKPGEDYFFVAGNLRAGERYNIGILNNSPETKVDFIYIF